MSTREVADYLRLKERKIYDFVAREVIPHSRVSGKLLFPRALVDEWVKRGMGGTPLIASRNAPAVLAGSHDPLLEWAVRESRCGLATMTYGSLDGVDRLLAGAACAAAIHIPAVAQQFHLDFVPLAVERLDIAVLRSSYFDPPLQALFAFTRRPLFQRQAKMLAGYDVAELGRVRWNGV